MEEEKGLWEEGFREEEANGLREEPDAEESSWIRTFIIFSGTGIRVY